MPLIIYPDPLSQFLRPHKNTKNVFFRGLKKGTEKYFFSKKLWGVKLMSKNHKIMVFGHPQGVPQNPKMCHF